MSNVALWSRPSWTFDQLLRDFLVPASANEAFPSGFNPAAEIIKDGDDALVRLELPGVDVEKDVKVEIDGGRLVISGERRDEHAEKADGRTLREVRYGSFQRSFAIPAHVTAEAVSAGYDAGVLTVRVKGAYAGSTAQRIAITTQPDIRRAPE
jgi:HSP20 family protein